jgi:YggT family protein
MDPSFFYVAIIYFFRILSWLIIARVLVSWLAPRSQHPVVVFIVQTSEAVIAPVRSVLPKGSGSMAMIDWSPLVALILLDLIRYGLIRFVVF